jgi:hypothetical protein
LLPDAKIKLKDFIKDFVKAIDAKKPEIKYLNKLIND